MSGSRSDKFIGRSFDDTVQAAGYQGSAPLNPAGSFVAAAHVRFNGAMTQAQDANAYALTTSSVDALAGFTLAVFSGVTGVGDGGVIPGVAASAGDGANSETILMASNNIAGVLGKEAVIYMWYLAQAQSFGVGINGVFSALTVLGGPLAASAVLPEIGGKIAVPANLSMRAGLASVAEVGICEIPGNDPTEAEIALASIRMVEASKKAGALRLYDPDVVDFGNGDQGILAGLDWTHYWRPGTTDANAPETLVDEGAAASADMTLVCPQADTSLIIQPGTCWASSEFAVPAPPEPPEIP